MWMAAYETLGKNIASVHELLLCERCDVRFIRDTTFAIFGSKRWKASRVCRQQRPLAEESTYLAVTLDSWNKFLNKSLTCMFDGSHNFAITFLYAKGSVQANISSDVLPTVNFIQPMQLRALYTVSTSRKTIWPRSPRKTTNVAIMRFISLKNIASLKMELIICVKVSAGIFINRQV